MRRASLLLTFHAGAACAGATDLAWLAGAWCGDDNGTWDEEIWLAPRAGSLIGAHRDTRGDTLRAFEFFRIVEDGDGLVFWAQPGGKPAVAFRGRPSGQSIDFVNPQHGVSQAHSLSARRRHALRPHRRRYRHRAAPRVDVAPELLDVEAAAVHAAVEVGDVTRRVGVLLVEALPGIVRQIA